MEDDMRGDWLPPRLAEQTIRTINQTDIIIGYQTDDWVISGYVENVFEALDTPGQWYLDRPTGTLYYMPMPGETPDSATVIAPRLPQLVRVVGQPKGEKPVLNLDFEGLAFSHADWRLPDDDAGEAADPAGAGGHAYGRPRVQAGGRGGQMV